MSEGRWDKHTKHLSKTALSAIGREYSINDLLEMEDKMAKAHKVEVSESHERVYFFLDYRLEALADKYRTY